MIDSQIIRHCKSVLEDHKTLLKAEAYSMINEYEERIRELERQLAESRAEHARALDGMARLHEQYLGGAK